jgi:uncharacterized membrane protein YqjE
MRRSARQRLALVHSRRGAGRASRQSAVREQESALAAEEPAPELEGLGKEFGGLFASARRVAWTYVDLISLEARRAGMTLMWMATWSGVAALLIGGGWFALMGAVAVWANAQGFSWAQALLTVALVSAALAAAVIFIIGTRLSRHLLFPATRRQLARQLKQDQEHAEEP